MAVGEIDTSAYGDIAFPKAPERGIDPRRHRWTRNDVARLVGMGRAKSNPAVSNKALRLLNVIATEHESPLYRAGAKEALWDIANPGEPFPATQLPRGETEYAAPTIANILKEETEKTVADSEPSSQTPPVGYRLARTLFSPERRKQMLYDVATGITLGHNVLPALADKIAGTSEFTPEAMAQAEKDDLLPMPEMLASKLVAPGAVLSKALKPISMGIRSTLGPMSPMKTAAAQGLSEMLALQGLGTLASGLEQGLAESPEGTPEEDQPTFLKGVKRGATDPVTALLGLAGGFMGGMGRGLREHSHPLQELQRQGGNAGIASIRPGAAGNSVVYRAGTLPSGKITPESMSVAAEKAGKRVSDLERIAYEKAKKAYDTEVKRIDKSQLTAPNVVNVSDIYATMGRHIDKQDLPPETQNFLAKTLLRFREEAQFVPDAGEAKILMLASKANQLRSELSNKIYNNLTKKKDPDIAKMAKMARESLEDTPYGALNAAYHEAMENIISARDVTGFSRPRATFAGAELLKEQSPIASKMAERAHTRASTGYEPPELIQAYETFPGLSRYVMDPLAALAAAKQLQLVAPRVYPRTGQGGISASGIMPIGGPEGGTGGALPRLVAPTLQAARVGGLFTLPIARESLGVAEQGPAKLFSKKNDKKDER